MTIIVLVSYFKPILKVMQKAIEKQRKRDDGFKRVLYVRAFVNPWDKSGISSLGPEEIARFQ